MGDIPPVRDTIMATDWRWWWSLWGKESLSSHQSCPHNWKKFPHGEVSVLVPGGSCNERGKMYAKGEAVFNLLWKWLIFQLFLDQRWLTNFLLPSLIRKQEFLNLLQVYSVTLLMSYIPLVIGKVSYTGHRTWPPQHFHKERLEIVAKAVTRVKDGSFEMIFVSAAKGKQKGFVEKFHECGVPKLQTIIWSPSNNGEELKRWLCEADLAIVPSG